MRRYILVIGSSILLIAVGAIYYELHSHRSPTVTTEIGEYEMRMGAGKGVSRVRISSIRKESTGLFDAADIRTSRLQVTGVVTDTLVLPDALDLAAKSALVTDLEGDGQDEVVLFGSMYACVVWVEGGKLRTRQDVDVLKSVGGVTTPKAADEQAFFVARTEYPPNASHAVLRPRLFSWTRQNGFADVTSSHPAFVRGTLLPELKELLANEKESAHRAAFESVITQLYQESK